MSVTSDFPVGANALLMLRNHLQQQRSELTEAIERTHREIRALAESGPGDVIDESCGNSSKEAIFRAYTQNRMQLRKVEAALRRITLGDFGTCTECCEAIGAKRLQALPWATNCIECQEKSEQGRIQ